MNNSLVQILVLGAIAIFLILKLRSVLGSREGFERPPLPREAAPSQISPRKFDVIEGGPDPDITDHAPAGSDTAKALAQMKQIEPAFAVGPFLKGARSAYEMILTAFDSGEIDRIRPFLAADVAQAFDAAAAERRAGGLAVQTTILGIRELALDAASYDATTRQAEISVRYVTELTRVVRDARGQVVEGHASTAQRQRDIWTFGRVMGAPDPNWQLVATGD